MKRLTLSLLSVVIFAVLGHGCNDTGFAVSTISPVLNGPDPLGPTVCDPFGGNGGAGTSQNGIEAKLTYLPVNATAIATGLSTASFDPTAPDVVVSPVRLILSQLNVTTRPFTEGFATKGSGDKLTDLNGDLLDEYFSVRGTANIRLGPSDAAATRHSR